jgi:hypothetical protein
MVKHIMADGTEFFTFNHCAVVGFEHSQSIGFRAGNVYGGSESIEEARESIKSYGGKGKIELVETVGHGYAPREYNTKVLEIID